MASFPLTVIRSAFGVADHLAPRLTGRLAFELFCRTPHPERISERERQVLDRAAPIMAEARLHRLGSGRRCVAAYEFRPPAGVQRRHTVLAVHGWHSRADHMVAIVEALRREGARVIAVDLPGHGRSFGRRLNMALAVRALALAGEWFGPFDAVIGHSFGGAVAVNAVVGSVKGVPRLAAARLALIAAPDSMPAFFADFGRMLNLGPRAQTALFNRVEEITGRPLDEFVGSLQLAGTDIPTLVLHAPEDKEVPAANAWAYGEAGPHVRLVWAPGLGHRRILAGPGVIAELTDFVAGGRAKHLVAH